MLNEIGSDDVGSNIIERTTLDIDVSMGWTPDLRVSEDTINKVRTEKTRCYGKDTRNHILALMDFEKDPDKGWYEDVNKSILEIRPDIMPSTVGLDDAPFLAENYNSWRVALAALSPQSKFTIGGTLYNLSELKEEFSGLDDVQIVTRLIREAAVFKTIRAVDGQILGWFDAYEYGKGLFTPETAYPYFNNGVTSEHLEKKWNDDKTEGKDHFIYPHLIGVHEFLRRKPDPSSQNTAKQIKYAGMKLLVYSLIDMYRRLVIQRKAQNRELPRYAIGTYFVLKKCSDLQTGKEIEFETGENIAGRAFNLNFFRECGFWREDHVTEREVEGKIHRYLINVEWRKIYLNLQALNKSRYGQPPG